MTTSTGSGTRRDTTVGLDLGLLILRGTIGVLFMGHGLGKLFGWFRQGGIEGTGAFFEAIGYSPGEELAVFAGLVELGAGLLLLTGFLMPLAAAMIIGDMFNAAWFKSIEGFWIADNGYEYEFVLIVVMAGLVLTGPGRFSVDRDRDWFGSRTAAVAVAIVVGLASGIIMRLTRG